MSKSTILDRVRANKPAPRPLPTLPVYKATDEDNLEVFTTSLASSKGQVIQLADLNEYIQTNFPEAKQTVSAIPQVQGNVDLASIDDPLQLAGVDLAVLPARFAVAENGAMWVSEREMGIRVLPFITQHLILVVQQGIVPTMHEAYAQIDIAETGFGVFIAGPSKTADIEQSLVIGAHGPRSLAVAFID